MIVSWRHIQRITFDRSGSVKDGAAVVYSYQMRFRPIFSQWQEKGVES